MKKLMCLTVVMVLAVNASAAVWVGTDTVGGTTAGDGIWSNANNWVTDDAIANPPSIVQGTVPTGSDDAWILGQYIDDVWHWGGGPAAIDPSFNPGPATINGNAQTNDLQVGRFEHSGELHVSSSATVQVNGQLGVGFASNYCYMTNEGTIDVAGPMWVGWSSQHDIQVDNYGTINVGGNLNLAQGGIDPGVMTNHSGTLDIAGAIDMSLSSGFGRLEVYGGTVEAAGLVYDAYYQDNVDITEGVLILDGDWVNGELTINPANGMPEGWGLPYWLHEVVFNTGTENERSFTQMTAYDGAGTIMYDYDITNPGQTTIWAVPEPATMSLLGLGAVALLRRKK